MDERRRRQLRQEYLKLRERYARRSTAYDCGVTLAEYICADLSEWGRRMREIEAEVEEAIREDRARGNAVPFMV